MKKIYKIFLLTIILVLVYVGITLKDIVELDKLNDLVVEGIGGESFTWTFDIDELTEEQLELYNELSSQGVSFSEIIRQVLPEEYKKFEANPMVMKMLNEQEDRRIDS